MQRLLTLTLLLCLFLCTCGRAQTTLSGVVVDEADGAPLTFVYVFLKSDQDYGVITNERGEYRIELREDQLNDQLVFSLMSYQTHTFPLEKLQPEQTVYNLQMTTSFLELKEIVVLSDRGLRNIVRETLANIPNAYGHKKYLLKAYYRHYDIENGQYAQLTDAMVTIQDRPYRITDNLSNNLTPDAPEQGQPVQAWVDEFRISDYNGNAPERFQSRKGKQRRVMAGYDGALNQTRLHRLHWMNAMVSLDSLYFINRGEYLEGSDTLIRIAYGYELKNKGLDEATKDQVKNWLSGEVLINRNDKAILRNTQGSLDKGQFTDLSYHKVNGKYYLKQIIKDGRFRFDSLRNQLQYNYIFYVTDVITRPEDIRSYKKGKRINSELTVEDIRTPYRPEFWEANAIIQQVPAPEALESGLSRMRSLEEQFRGNARKVKER